MTLKMHMHKLSHCQRKKTEIFERFNTVERVIQDLGIGCAYVMPSFWTSDRKDYKVIETKYHKGYMQALEDVEKEIRVRFGFAERSNEIVASFTSLCAEREET